MNQTAASPLFFPVRVFDFPPSCLHLSLGLSYMDACFRSSHFSIFCFLWLFAYFNKFYIFFENVISPLVTKQLARLRREFACDPAGGGDANGDVWDPFALELIDSTPEVRRRLTSLKGRLLSRSRSLIFPLSASLCLPLLDFFFL